MDEIKTLLQQYKWVVEKLEKINSYYSKIEKYDKVSEELNKVKKELEKEKKENLNNKRIIQMLNYSLVKLNNMEICRECDWEWWWEDWQWWWWVCEKCGGTWFIEIK